MAETASASAAVVALLIAAQAITLGYTLVTGNESEFSRIPELSWENWLR